MLDKDGPLMELMRPFISEQLGLEAILDVQPAGILLGGRGGVTAEGVKVYSPSDNISDKMEKSLLPNLRENIVEDFFLFLDCFD